MPPRPERPSDADDYEGDRVELFSQGDLFRDMPRAYPLPADELVVDEESGGSRRFLSGPLEFRAGDADHTELLDGCPGNRGLRPAIPSGRSSRS
jgi:hypothetical protein